MRPIEFRNAFYIKLGESGKWEADSLETAKLRIGWNDIALTDINTGNWPVIEEQLTEGKVREGKKANKGAITRDVRALRRVKESTQNDVWVTFFRAKLWWTRLNNGPVEMDSISKFRRAQGWHDKDAKGRLLAINDIPGSLSKTQAFRGAVCAFHGPRVATIERVLSGQRSARANMIDKQRSTLIEPLVEVIQDLNPKDFETFVDLVFRHAGWNRVSILGQQERSYDLELRQPITDERCLVQVKTKAHISDLAAAAKAFSSKGFHKVFFVVHTPVSGLLNDELATQAKNGQEINILLPDRLAELAIDAGLLPWLMNKAW